MDDLVGIGPDPLDGSALSSLVGHVSRGAGDGAVVTFLGTVRDQNLGRVVHYLEYEAYEELAVRTFRLIVDEAREHWPDTALGLRHRVGRLMPGEASIIIAAASPHRAHAFAACRYTIERVKQVAPIWKREFFAGGDTWIEGATADPGDNAAREQAYKRSCV
jgi:molybdopterin synthase catalytic subunit